ncbi:MAG: M24 family metallopeptidase [Chloroflexales bacterium]|nr:M24 family metallopeptidase [Chloroflexales bacterium]
MTHAQEWHEKRTRLAQLMTQRGLKGILLTRCANFSWITCGGQAHVGVNSETAVASVLCTPNGDYLLASRIEMVRMQTEETAGLPLTPHQFDWFDPTARDRFVDDVCGVGCWGSDIAGAAYSVAGELTGLRVNLTSAEQNRFVSHGLATGLAIEAAARLVAPGMHELEVAGILAQKVYASGATPVVTLIAGDERIRSYRHPAPTLQRVTKMAMLVVCARRYGLIVSATRLISFGRIGDEIAQRAEACAYVDAVAWHASQPGRLLGDAFGDVCAAYAARGYADEWHKHHQGGVTGYENREIQARIESIHPIAVGQAFAWNPSITGTKSEDTMLLTDHGPHALSTTGQWPMIATSVAGVVFERPGILER